jgi:hypothetical protein
MNARKVLEYWGRNARGRVVMFEDLLVVDQCGLADLGGKFHAAEWRGGDT